MKRTKVTNSTALFDVDGVVLNYPDGFDEWVQNKKGMDRVDGKYGIGYRMSDWYTVSPGPFENLIYDFNDTIYAANLKPYPDVIKAMKQAYQDFGTTYTFVTKFGNDPVLKRGRIANIQKFIPNEAIEDFIFVDLNHSKEEALSPWRNTEILFVEDFYRNALDANAMGIDCRLIERGYNTEEIATHKLKSIRDGKHLYDLLQRQ